MISPCVPTVVNGIFNQPHEFAIDFDEAGLKVRVPLLRESVPIRKYFYTMIRRSNKFQQEQNLSLTEPYLSSGIVAT